MAELNTKLFTSHLSAGYTEAEWKEIAGHVIAKLEEFLDQPVATAHFKFDSRGFDGDIGSPVPFAGQLSLSWFGRIGANVAGRDEITVLQAFIYFRGGGKRLVAINGEAYLWLEYREFAEGVFGWTAPVWERDIFGEFEDWA